MTGTMAFHKDISAIATECFGEKQGVAKKFAAMVKAASESLTGKGQDLLFVKEVIDDATQLLKEQGVSNSSKTMLARGRLAMIYTALTQSIDTSRPASQNILDDIKKRRKEILSGWINEQKTPTNKAPNNNTNNSSSLERAYKNRLRGPGVFSV